MDLLEYQAKEWFRGIGIPVLPSQRIDRLRDLKELRIPYPIVLKSQVHAGGRGKAGGVKFVENTIDAIATAQAIFHLPIFGELPDVLLAEVKYVVEQEFYLAVVLDAAVRRPVLLGSAQGGIDVEAAVEQIQHVVVEQEFSAFYARRLALKMGLQGELIQSVSTIIEKMYQLFVQKDLDMVEINPLGVSATGELMALDGKVTVNDKAIGRHPDIVTVAQKPAIKGYGKNGHAGKLTGAKQAGNIGILGNGAGLVMATLDLVTDAGGKPATCLNIGHRVKSEASQNTLGDRLERGLELLMQDKKIQILLVNILASVPTALEVADVIADFVHRHQYNLFVAETSAHLGFPRLVIRLAGSELDSARLRLANMQLPMVENIDEAVAQVVRLAKLYEFNAK